MKNVLANLLFLLMITLLQWFLSDVCTTNGMHIVIVVHLYGCKNILVL